MKKTTNSQQSKSKINISSSLFSLYTFGALLKKGFALKGVIFFGAFMFRKTSVS